MHRWWSRKRAGRKGPIARTFISVVLHGWDKKSPGSQDFYSEVKSLMKGQIPYNHWHFLYMRLRLSFLPLMHWRGTSPLDALPQEGRQLHPLTASRKPRGSNIALMIIPDWISNQHLAGGKNRNPQFTNQGNIWKSRHCYCENKHILKIKPYNVLGT